MDNKIEGRKTYAFYHVTPYDFGATFVAIPKVPENRYGAKDHSGDTEDPFTPRVCLSADLDGAILGAGHQLFGYAVLYGADDIPGFIDPLTDGKFCGSRNAPYGPDFSWTAYLGFKPSRAEQDILARMLKFCVPDAEATGEVWATRPVLLHRVGYLDVAQGVYLAERPKPVKCVKPERLERLPNVQRRR